VLVVGAESYNAPGASNFGAIYVFQEFSSYSELWQEYNLFSQYSPSASLLLIPTALLALVQLALFLFTTTTTAY